MIRFNLVASLATLALLLGGNAFAYTQDNGTVGRIYVPQGAPPGYLAFTLNGGFPNASGSYGCATGSYGFAGEIHGNPTLRALIFQAKATGAAVTVHINGCIPAGSPGSGWFQIMDVYLN